MTTAAAESLEEGQKPQVINQEHQRNHVITLIVLSIAASVGLILGMKVVMSEYHCRYVLFLSSSHFLATTLYTRISAHYGKFQPKRDIPVRERWLLAALGTASIACMNFNLQFNSVGFYQMTKLLCIPWMIVAQRYFQAKFVTLEILVALTAILFGVGLVTVTDVQVNTTGFIFGVLAVATTAQFQLWQGSKQTQFQLSAIQILDAVMPYQLAVCFTAAVILESGFFFELGTNSKPTEWGPGLTFFILLTCVMAVAVNYLTYALIGKTSAVTYQVVGHFKTILTLLGGYVLFSHAAQQEQSLGRQFLNVAGIVVALLGMMVYGDIKTNASGAQLNYLRRTLPKIRWDREF